MTEETTQEAVAEAKPQGKSIIDPKYRNKYKQPDWLGGVINGATNNMKTIAATEASEAVGKIGEEGYKPAREAKPERTVADGVDIDKVFALGRENGLNLDKFETQRAAHGFGGRIRMTVRNMLQTVAKQRHGLMVNGTFIEAPADWLHSKSAPTNPTHTQDGTKIAKVKEPVAEAGESKLIKAEPEKVASAAPAKAATVKKPKK